jgi:hypothetical protein
MQYCNLSRMLFDMCVLCDWMDRIPHWPIISREIRLYNEERCGLLCGCASLSVGGNVVDGVWRQEGVLYSVRGDETLGKAVRDAAGCYAADIIVKV